MPFDPTLPAAHSPNSSAEMRGQLTALADLIAAQETRIAALESALAGTARDPVSVGPFSTSLNDPPSAAQVQAILDVLNALIGSVKRA